jgi:hypothetical protein
MLKALLETLSRENDVRIVSQKNIELLAVFARHVELHAWVLVFHVELQVINELFSARRRRRQGVSFCLSLSLSLSLCVLLEL